MKDIKILGVILQKKFFKRGEMKKGGKGTTRDGSVLSMYPP